MRGIRNLRLLRHIWTDLIGRDIPNARSIGTGHVRSHFLEPACPASSTSHGGEKRHAASAFNRRSGRGEPDSTVANRLPDLRVIAHRASGAVAWIVFARKLA